MCSGGDPCGKVSPGRISLPAFALDPRLQVMGCVSVPARAEWALSLLFYLFSAPEELDLLWRAVKIPESGGGTGGLIRSDLSQRALGSSRVFLLSDTPDCRIKAFQKPLMIICAIKCNCNCWVEARRAGKLLLLVCLGASPADTNPPCL